MSKGIIYYTRNKVNFELADKCRKQIQKAELPIVSVSSEPIEFDNNIVLSTDGGFLEMAEKILIGLKTIDADVVFFCEDDVLYHPTHFNFIPLKKNVYYYDVNVWRIRAEDGFALHYDAKQLNMIFGYRDLLIKHYEKRIGRIKDGVSIRAMGFEPGSHHRKERIDDFKSEYYKAEFPSLDIRHDSNLTANRWRKDQFRSQRNCPNWQEKKVWELEGWDFWTKGNISRFDIINCQSI